MAELDRTTHSKKGNNGGKAAAPGVFFGVQPFAAVATAGRAQINLARAAKKKGEAGDMGIP